MADQKKKITFRDLFEIDWEPYFQLLKYLSPYKVRFIIGVVAGMLFGVINGGIPWVLNYVGQKLFPGIAISKDLMVQGALGGAGPKIGSVIGVVLLIPLIMIARSLVNYLNSYCMAWVSLRMLRDLRKDLFAHLIGQSLDFFNRQKIGTLISRVMNDTRVAQDAIVSISGDIFKDPISIISGVVVLFVIDWKFCIASVIIFPVVIIPITIFSRKVRKAGMAEQNLTADMTVALQESFAGVRVIKSFAREGYQAAHCDKINNDQCQNSMRVRKSQQVVQPLIEAVSACGAVFAILYVNQTGKSAFTLIALLMGMFLMYEPAKRLSKIPLLLQRCMVAATNVFDLLKLNPTIMDKPAAVTLKDCRGEILFENINFTYGIGKSALENINLNIEAGKRYALVGASGAGKSTMMSLLLRFYDPQGGAIRVDGHDLRDLQQISLRENIGIVTQETFLFHDTIYENIRYGRLDATEAEIMAAAKLAFAHDFIMEKPEGYNTIVGDKGSLLSGGQQQRLAIARALLKNAPILLLDEATSALDSESEKMIQTALERLAEGRTVIAIAHRLSTVLKSDAIVVMDHGRIVEVGTHKELLDKSPLYRKLYELQFHSHEEDSPSPEPATLLT